MKTVSLSETEIALLRDVLHEAIDAWSGVGEDNDQIDAQINMAWDILERLS